MNMPNYRRLRQPGGTYFFTVVTYNRRPLFNNDTARQCLHQAIAQVRKEQSFILSAIVLLPDHLHCIWTLPENDALYAKRWACIKRLFTQQFIKQVAMDRELPQSYKSRHEGGLWQRRFWEHSIRDDSDFENHVNYIHYNAVKHGLVTCPHLWPYSSFHNWCKQGIYSEDWACCCHGKSIESINFSHIENYVGE